MRWLTGLVVVAALLVTACSDDPPDGYGADVEESFLETCRSGSGEDLTDVCQCIYDRVEAEVPFEEFRSVDEALAEDPTSDLPPEFVDIYTDCVLEAAEG